MTYREHFIALITLHDRPMKAKEIIECIQQIYPGASNQSIRQALMVSVKKKIIAKVEVDGISSFYANPGWLVNGKLKKEYTNLHWNANKQIQVQQSNDCLERIA